MRHLLSLAVRHDQDVVFSRQRAAQVAQLLGYDLSEQTKIATAVSEIVRNAFRYAGGGDVAFAVDEAAQPQRLHVRISDSGPGIRQLDAVLAGQYRSTTGMGLGISGARRLMDHCSIESSPSGTTVVLEKFLSPRQDVLTAERTSDIQATLARRRPDGLVEEVMQQNQALLRALDELQRKQQELVHLNRELEDTNRGVVALYAELDEKADHLRRADDLKSQFLSNMTHEFRTPVNSIIGLTGLLFDERRDAGREPEPEVVYIRKAAEQLSELVNDLLDLAKVEAGKTVVRPATFEVQKLFGALRGMLRPLLLNQSLSLVFDVPPGMPPIYTDESKLSQVLRNLISNALKFTERGEVRVSAAAPADDGTIALSVSDTGIGIAPDDQERIFEEFTQVEHPLQGRVKGTGLGLPLARRLTGLLGGALTVRSEPGMGATFTVAIPSHYVAPVGPGEAFEWVPDSGRLPLLVVDEDADTQQLYDKVLRSSAYQVYPARTIHEAEVALGRVQPSAVILDIGPADRETWELLVRLRRSAKTAGTAVVVVGPAVDRDKAMALGADAWLPKPVDRRRLLETLTSLHARTGQSLRVLLIDDEEVARYLVRQCLPVPTFHLTESASGEEGLRIARQEQPDLVLLDLILPGLGGLEVLERLRADEATRETPVIIVTSQALDAPTRDRLMRDAEGIFSKADVSRGTLAEAVLAAAARRRRRAVANPEP